MTKRSKTNLTWIERRAHAAGAEPNDAQGAKRRNRSFAIILSAVILPFYIVDLFSSASRDHVDKHEPSQVQYELLDEAFCLLSDIVRMSDYRIDREPVRTIRSTREYDFDLYSPGELHSTLRENLLRFEDVEWVKVLQIAEQDAEIRTRLDRFFAAANMPVSERLAQLPERGELHSFPFNYVSEEFGDHSLSEFGVQSLRDIHGDDFRDTLPAMPTEFGTEWILRIHAVLRAASRVLMYTEPQSWK